MLKLRHIGQGCVNYSSAAGFGARKKNLAFLHYCDGINRMHNLLYNTHSILSTEDINRYCIIHRINSDYVRYDILPAVTSEIIGMWCRVVWYAGTYFCKNLLSPSSAELHEDGTSDFPYVVA